MRYLSRPGDNLVVTTGLGNGGAISIYWVYTKNAAKHPAITVQPLQQIIIWPQVSIVLSWKNSSLCSNLPAYLRMPAISLSSLNSKLQRSVLPTTQADIAQIPPHSCLVITVLFFLKFIVLLSRSF